jgi:hypothetical protein
VDLLLALDINTGEARRGLLADGRANTLIAMELWDFGLGYARTSARFRSRATPAPSSNCGSPSSPSC